MERNIRGFLLTTASLAALGFVVSSPAVGADLYEAPPAGPVEVPVLAGRTLSGTLDFYGGYSWLTGDPGSGGDNSETDRDYPLAGAKGRVDIPFNETTSLQLDFGGEAAFPVSKDDSTSAEDNYAGNVTLGAHLNFRDSDRYLFGVFAGGGETFHLDTGSDGQPAPFYFAGVEGQMYFGNSTLYGQGGYLNSAHPENETLENAWFARGVGRHYFGQGGTKAEIEISYASGQQDIGSDNVSILGWAAELEHQFASWSNDGLVSGYLRYEGRKFDETTTGDGYGEHTLMVGIKIDFNQSSLLSRDRTGATLDLPNFGRWVGGTIAVD